MPKKFMFAPFITNITVDGIGDNGMVSLISGNAAVGNAEIKLRSVCSYRKRW